ncbi:hypothetical protein LM602_06905 [Candidatus Acetothermia bacterium]|jgi:hypothetical protein|nr:hypothetical protein [Candidatus Acetothermia bacterium]MCI2432264.1 hypothetical protein [Candidatus Acetothermia bacterium]MCI2436520.1 hypothetical protein [Candidatus Acetothermia bacterium]
MWYGWQEQIALIILAGIAAVIIGTLLMRWLWNTTIPALFPKAVETGQVNAQIDYVTAFKLLVFLVLVALVF